MRAELVLPPLIREMTVRFSSRLKNAVGDCFLDPCTGMVAVSQITSLFTDAFLTDLVRHNYNNYAYINVFECTSMQVLHEYGSLLTMEAAQV